MKKITIKDIAIEARVSISTVSFVLNDKGEKMGIYFTDLTPIKACHIKRSNQNKVFKNRE